MSADSTYGCYLFHKDASLMEPETSLAEYVSSPAVQRIFPGVNEFVRFESPLRRVDRLHCPVFLFHAEDDATVPVAASRAFAEKLSVTGTTPYLQTVASGGHRDAMLSEGIPAAIAWLKQQTENR
ncbi:prolyl oligopeptidase family serine peptidase [bacterium]|nr:prolyl oligopeptidase family serine peptidase [bacterium]